MSISVNENKSGLSVWAIVAGSLVVLSIEAMDYD